MKFQLAVNLERMDDTIDMQDVARHTLEMVQMAEAGFNIVWAAEHHALEMTMAPILSNSHMVGKGDQFSSSWHCRCNRGNINLAGEAAFLDLISGGRLDFGIGSGLSARI